MITAALILNIAVLVPVCLGLLTSAGWASAAYGPATPARGILLSVYLAILVGSLALLVVDRSEMAVSLLAVQVVYKVTTPFTVGTVRNPVVVSNLLIAAFHAAAIASFWPI